MNFFGKRESTPDALRVPDRHVTSDGRVIDTYVEAVSVTEPSVLLNITGEADAMLFDLGIFDHTDCLDIANISHVVSDGRLIKLQSGQTQVRHNGRLTTIALRGEMALTVEINVQSGLAQPLVADNVTHFILTGSRAFNSNMPDTNLIARPLGKKNPNAGRPLSN